MKGNLTITIDVKLLELLRKKVGKGNISVEIEKLLKKKLGVD